MFCVEKSVNDIIFFFFDFGVGVYMTIKISVLWVVEFIVKYLRYIQDI